MDISCPDCKARFRIPEDEIREIKGAVWECPKCGGSVPIPGEASQGASTIFQQEAATYDASKKPFDFLEAGSRTAIICATEAAAKETAIKAIEKMGYHITIAADSREALRNMWYHPYDLVFLDEMFDTQNPDHNRVLAYLEGLSMSIRRKMVVILCSRGLRTMDEMGAFQKSVNMVINIKHLQDIARVLSAAIQEHSSFYQVYKDIAKRETAL